jgi:hypothetical protein
MPIASMTLTPRRLTPGAAFTGTGIAHREQKFAPAVCR